VRFVITYRHSGFAALKAENVPPTEKLDGRSLWGGFAGELLDFGFDSFQPDKSDSKYDGHIRIVLKELEHESFEKTSRTLDLQRTPYGYLRLPTAVVDATIDIDNVPNIVRRTLAWYSKKTADIDYVSLARKDLPKFLSLLHTLFRNDEKALFEYVKRYREKPDAIHVLARPDDEKFEQDFEERRKKSGEPELSEEEKKAVSILQRLIRRLKLDSKDAMPPEMFRVIGEELGHLAETRAESLKRNDKSGRLLRMHRWSKLNDLVSRISTGKVRRPQDVDFAITESFAKDLFFTFRHYWNLIVRYLKYERMQFWMREVAAHEYGMFFINNPVVCDGTEIVPYATVQMDLLLLTREEQYLTKDDWKDVQSVTAEIQNLERLAGGFQIGGVFSQAFQSLTDQEYETAVILGLIALDTAMTDLLTIIKPKYAHSTPGPKVPVVKKYFESGNRLGLTETEWDQTWSLISNDRRHGLLELRNEIVHEGKKLAHNDPKTRTDVLERLSAARLMAFRISVWTKMQPRRKLQGRQRWSSP